MTFELSYKTLTLGEIEKYSAFNFICDGDNKKLIINEKSNLINKNNSKLLNILRKEIGE